MKYLIVFTIFLLSFICLIVKYILSNKYETRAVEHVSEIPFIGVRNESENFSHTIVIVFSSTCEYCQNDAEQIRKHIDVFLKVKIFMVSPENTASIIKFSSDYKLNSFSNIRFLRMSKEEIYKTFSVITVPYILVYNQNGDLNKEIKGDIKIEKLIEVIANEKK
ncbi:redoxin domain-containing protein [Runella sp. MFBS21]|uniref:peroxiredoxin family protein n=1 Tax=Runella sp. MFBS21 TaxID=3034018 RepID=UPI0023F9AC6B|nr:redoxin domain-containing protein [Runella sp. MFBS21]MDF7816131.1 redoxin domain-containing protein [Runella sp. MFBS21]